ncbi:MAG: ZIP family metal transporter [Erysipelotrichaceae bacterium]|nr:ZIP family metal transporter [Erysipelotrichaceae bacterium]
MNFFYNLNPIIQTIIAATFTWSITALGAALVFIFKKPNKTMMDAMLGFAAGVMIAATFWSLLNPALEMASKLKMNSCLIVTIGFLTGGLFLFLGDRIYNHFNKNEIKKRCFMLILSITLHNIPEGLAIGVAFGSVLYGLEGATSASALLLALGIGIQNFPEGTAVSLPLKRDGYSNKKAFFIGQLSGIVEPIAAILGCILVQKIQTILPFVLAFAGGAMIYVVVQELIPESQTNEKKDLMALFTLIGFSIMMILDVVLG